jgi:hypothetical protein
MWSRLLTIFTKSCRSTSLRSWQTPLLVHPPKQNSRLWTTGFVSENILFYSFLEIFLIWKTFSVLIIHSHLYSMYAGLCFSCSLLPEILGLLSCLTLFSYQASERRCSELSCEKREWSECSWEGKFARLNVNWNTSVYIWDFNFMNWLKHAPICLFRKKCSHLKPISFGFHRELQI